MSVNAKTENLQVLAIEIEASEVNADSYSIFVAENENRSKKSSTAHSF